MKKILFTLLAAVLYSMTAYAQCQDENGETIYEIDCGESICGGICVIHGEFYLFGITDNLYGTANASIYLGNSTDMAMRTMRSLEILTKSKKPNEVYMGFDNKRTYVWQCRNGVMNCLVFKTEGIEGESYVLDNNFDYEFAIMAIGEYVSNY